MEFVIPKDNSILLDKIGSDIGYTHSKIEPKF